MSSSGTEILVLLILICLESSMMPGIQQVVSRIVRMTDLPVELLCSPRCHFSFPFPSGSARAESHSRVLEASRTNCCWLFLSLHIWHVWEVSRCLWVPGLKCASPCPPQLLGRRIQKEEGWSGACGMEALDVVMSADKDWAEIKGKALSRWKIFVLVLSFKLCFSLSLWTFLSLHTAPALLAEKQRMCKKESPPLPLY